MVSRSILLIGKHNPNGYNFDVSSFNRGKRAGTVTGDFIVYLSMDLGILVFSASTLGDVLLEPFFGYHLGK